MKDSMLEWLLKNSLISPIQYSFLLGRSTISRLITSLSGWISAHHQRIQTDAAYIEYAKAFDVVCSIKLLQKLQAYGVCCSLLKWIRCFLIDRCFMMRTNRRFIFQSRYIISAVPQGSVLGPLLFILYINDVSDNLSSVCKLLADGLKIYRPLHEW